MSPSICPFCERTNPADAKFCNACGGALHLVPCPGCGAVSDVSAITCYQCQAQLPGRRSTEPEPAPPAEAEPPEALPRQHPRGMPAAVVLAVVVVVVSYYGYRQSSLVDVPHPAAASSARPADAAPAKSDQTAQPVTPAVAPPETPPAGRAPAETKPRAEFQPEESRRPNAAAGQIARPRGGGAGQAPGQAPPRKELCTQAVEALGLCTMTPEERKLTEAIGAPKAASTRPAATDPRKSGAQEAPRQEPCTEAVEALGLCARASTQRRQ